MISKISVKTIRKRSAQWFFTKIWTIIWKSKYLGLTRSNSSPYCGLDFLPRIPWVRDESLILRLLVEFLPKHFEHNLLRLTTASTAFHSDFWSAFVAGNDKKLLIQVNVGKKTEREKVNKIVKRNKCFYFSQTLNKFRQFAHFGERTSCSKMFYVKSRESMFTMSMYIL